VFFLCLHFYFYFFLFLTDLDLAYELIFPGPSDDVFDNPCMYLAFSLLTSLFRPFVLL